MHVRKKVSVDNHGCFLFAIHARGEIRSVQDTQHGEFSQPAAVYGTYGQ